MLFVRGLHPFIWTLNPSCRDSHRVNRITRADVFEVENLSRVPGYACRYLTQTFLLPMEPDATIDEIRRKDALTDKDVGRLRSLTRAYPRDPYLWDVLGDIIQLVDGPSPTSFSSLLCYLNAIEADPTYGQAYSSLGHWHDIAENYHLARAYFEIAIQFGEGDSARISLAKILAQLRLNIDAYAILNTCDDPASDRVATVRAEIADEMLGPYVDDM